MKAIYIIVLLMFISVSKAQSHYDELYSYFVKSRYFDLNLNGPVLRMQYFFTEYNIGTNQTINNWTIINNEKRYLGSPYVEFDIKNQTFSRIVRYQNNTDLNLKEIYKERYYLQFEKEEIMDITSKLHINHYPVYTYFLQKTPSYKICFPNPSFDSKNQNSELASDSLYCNVIMQKVEADRNGNIIKFKNYNYLDHQPSKDKPWETEYSIHNNTIINFYNRKGLVITQNIKSGSGPGDLNFLFGEDWLIPFTALDTESGFCEDLHLSYQYDAKDRITDIVFFGCNDTLAKEHYTYDEKAGYVNKIRKYTGGIGGPVSVPKTVDLFYDEHANVIKREFIQPSHHTFSFNDIPQTTYYKYDYDKYNNWIKCYIYYTGKPEGEPTAVVERKIEYYES